MQKYATILPGIVFLIAVDYIAYAVVSVYDECRASGHSRTDCFMLIGG